MKVGEARLAADGLVLVFQRAVGPAKFLVSRAAIGIDGEIRGVEPYSLVVVRDCLFMLTLEIVGDAAVDERLRIPGIEANGFVIVLNGPVISPYL